MIPLLSINQATTRPYALTDTARASSAAGVRHLGLWLEPVAELGAAETVRLLDETGIRATSMSRTGFVADKSGAALHSALDDVRRAIELSAAVGAPTLSFIAGGLAPGDRDLRAGAGRVRDALEVLAPEARAAGVRLQLEPLHPLFATSRSVVTTVRQALGIIEGLPVESVGILVDAYATFWDADLHDALLAAGERIAGYQVNDFVLPLPAEDHMLGRLLPGEGGIDLDAITASVIQAGYTDPIEVEVFHEQLWALPLETIIERTVRTFTTAVVAPITARTEVPV
ncbi:sugar phosphate isomerase/epimerase family protein [Microbacterium saperdae]|uniref:Sugar phosphate isomerase/epimerase n=1 Tax=Microbacterium saperdae TaxID=69368 RepID=A0A543BLA2_9MICO|nr:sugar phosphate isomerase/epimerase family protein [Microbacterium saperdae]TQL85620.1 sugar phosphate isomerase/epimerase [Microbacterium saperdae]GGM62184.1 xylose isomerase [Microbacterium saperdae]